MEKMAPGLCKLTGTSRISDLEKNCFETNLPNRLFISETNLHAISGAFSPTLKMGVFKNKETYPS